jgi:hypothetical protein
MHKQRTIILIAAIIGAISVFLPWRTISVGLFGASVSEGHNGFEGAGALAFFCFLAAGLLAFAGDQASRLSKKSWLGVLAIAVVSFNCVVVYIVKLQSANFGFMKFDAGYGCYMALVASFVIGAAAWLLRGPDQNLKESFDKLKNNLSSISNSAQSKNASSEETRVDKIEEIERLVRLRDAGHITELEYQQMKSKLL